MNESLAYAPLHDLDVLECGTGVGSSFCATLLAQLGANVTKAVDARAAAPTEAAATRRRAEELYLDTLKARVPGPLMRDELAERARTAHVVIRGCDPYGGEADATTIDEEYETCRTANADVVFVVLTPFGVRGRGAVWHGGDLHAQGLSGWTYLVGNPDEAPLAMNYGVGALQLGLAGAGAALAAVLERGAAGGDFVDVAESDVVAAAMRMYSLAYHFLQIPMTRQGLRAPGSSGRYPHTLLPCKDGYISTICRSQVDWDRLVEMLGNPAWAQEERYKDFFRMGTEYADEVDALIVPWLMERTKAELSDLAAQYRVPLGPVNTVDEVLRDVQLLDRDFFREVKDGDDRVLVPGMVAHWRPSE